MRTISRTMCFLTVFFILLSGCALKEEDLLTATNTKILPVSTKMTINTGEMQIGSTSSTSGRIVADNLSGKILYATTSTDPCAEKNSDNSLLNLGFTLACSMGQLTKEIIVGKQTGDAIDCKDSNTEDGMLGGAACNIPAGTKNVKAFKADDGRYMAISFADFNSYNAKGSWTGDESTFPLAIRIWLGVDESSLSAAASLYLKSKTEGDLSVDFGLINKTGSGKARSTFNMTPTGSNCTATNANTTDCKSHDFWYTADCSNIEKDQFAYIRVSTLADADTGFNFARVQYDLKFCQTKTESGMTYNRIAGKSVKNGSQVYVEFTYYNDTTAIYTVDLPSGTDYETIIEGVLSQWLKEMSSAGGDSVDGICYSQTAFNMNDSFWNTFYNGGTNPSITHFDDAIAKENLCSGMNSSVFTNLDISNISTETSAILNAFGSAPTSSD